MKPKKFFVIVLIFISISFINLYSQVINRGWGCAYNDIMNPAANSKDGSLNEYDMYITFIRCIKNKFAQKDSGYASIPSSVYGEVWICNKSITNFKPEMITLNQLEMNLEFQNENRMHWILSTPLVGIRPYDAQNLQMQITYSGLEFTNVNFNGMMFPEFFIISEAPSNISTNSEQDFTIKVANALQVRTSGFTLATPDAVSLYFYTIKNGRQNAFKTPVNPVPAQGAPWFNFVYPGKNIKADYEAQFFELGEGAAVVKSAKSYPLTIQLKDIQTDLKCLVTFVVKAEKTYNYIP